jgi:tetratricopeptide (TPR) repeat protein
VKAAATKRTLLLAVLISCFSCTFSQEGKYIDSLVSIINTSKTDSVIFNAYDYLCSEYIINAANYEKGMVRAKELLKLAKAKNKSYWEGAAYNYLGNAEQGTGNFNKAIEYFTLSLNTYSSKKSRAQQGVAYSNLAETYRLKGDYQNSLKFNLAALKIREEDKDSAYISTSLNNIGSVYHLEGNFEKALEYYHRAMEIRKKMHKKISVAMSLNNIGLVYQERASQSIRNGNRKDVSADYYKALGYYKDALKIVEDADSPQGQSILYNNVGNIYHLRGENLGDKKDYDTAMIYYNKALEWRLQMNDKPGLAASYNNIGNIQVARGNYDKGLEYFKKSLEIATALDYKEVLTAAYHDIALANGLKGDYKSAYEWLQKYAVLKDSMLGEENAKAMAKMQALYDTEKKDKDLLKKDAELAIQKVSLTEQQEKNKRQKVILFSSIAGLLVVIGFSAVLFSRLKLIRNQKKIIESQKELVEEKNKDITDSINYAQKIQTAMLPGEEELKKLFPESFIFFRPRDIVSGDFYWCARREDSLYLAVADCTGHGVPGALMSMIGTSLLHQLLAHPDTSNLSVLLHELDKEIIRSLKQQDKDSESRDGMDIAIVEIRRTEKKIFYAGANRPLLILTGQHLSEIQPTKTPIGGITSGKKEFNLHQISFGEGSRIFLFSDGYVDQFGGPKGKKFMSKNLKELIVSTQDLSIQEQGKILERKFGDWQGKFEQVDDVCIIGVKL